MSDNLKKNILGSLATSGPTEAREPQPEEQSLENQLDELEQKQEAAAAAEANYAGLEKLIEEANKAEGDYAEAYDQLQDRETRLTTEQDALSKALEAVLGSRVEEVKTIIGEKVKAVSDAAGARDEARAAVEEAQSNVDQAAEEMAALQAKLDMWRKPVVSMDRRLKVAEGLIEEIKKLRNAGKRGEAYWKLVLGDHVGEPGKKFLEGQEFLNAVLDREPKVIRPKICARRSGKRGTNSGSSGKRWLAPRLFWRRSTTNGKRKRRISPKSPKNLIKAIAEALANQEARSDAA